MAEAVTATIGTWWPGVWRSRCRISAVASYPLSTGIWQSIRTAAYGTRSTASTASMPLATTATR